MSFAGERFRGMVGYEDVACSLTRSRRSHTLDLSRPNHHLQRCSSLGLPQASSQRRVDDLAMKRAARDARVGEGHAEARPQRTWIRAWCVGFAQNRRGAVTTSRRGQPRVLSLAAYGLCDVCRYDAPGARLVSLHRAGHGRGWIVSASESPRLRALGSSHHTSCRSPEDAWAARSLASHRVARLLVCRPRKS